VNERRAQKRDDFTQISLTYEMISSKSFLPQRDNLFILCSADLSLVLLMLLFRSCNKPQGSC
jgi:hypothetical protein